MLNRRGNLRVFTHRGIPDKGRGEDVTFEATGKVRKLGAAYLKGKTTAMSTTLISRSGKKGICTGSKETSGPRQK